MQETTNALMSAVTTALGSLIDMIGDVVTAIVGSSGALNTLLPLFAIGISIAVFGFAIRAVRSIVWGA